MHFIETNLHNTTFKPVQDRANKTTQRDFARGRHIERAASSIAIRATAEKVERQRDRVIAVRPSFFGSARFGTFRAAAARLLGQESFHFRSTPPLLPPPPPRRYVRAAAIPGVSLSFDPFFVAAPLPPPRRKYNCDPRGAPLSRGLFLGASGPRATKVRARARWRC